MTTDATPAYTNELAKETSPYLLQHAHNPVNWVPWSKGAFDQARNEEKLVLISIGYSSCHWCHVMEHESFEDTAVAKVMNDHFVCIKVDREERPDVDDVYMTAVQIITGRGGWPLNCFALPDGRPVYGGTYFRKDQWVQVLTQLTRDYKSDPDKFNQYADNLSNGMASNELKFTAGDTTSLSMQDVEVWINKWKNGLDHEWGGPNKAPKFPIPDNYQLLLRWAVQQSDAHLLKHVETTLDRMEQGGIYDQVGGGFARYSVDAYWKVPHFEKMLYDNGQLLSLYANGFKVFKKERYAEVIQQTIDFCERELKHPDGGYYSALDADSEGEEGKFYVWTIEELKAVTGEDFDWFSDYYRLKDFSHWEHGNYVLCRTPDVGTVLETHNLEMHELKAKLKDAHYSLLKAREKRIRPGLDDKILASWNGMLLSGLVDAYRALEDENHLELAVDLGEYLLKNMLSANGIWHSVQKGSPKIEGFLDDHVFVAQGLLDLYQVTLNDHYLQQAIVLIEHALGQFTDQEGVYCYFSASSTSDVFTRKKEYYDNVIPSSNGVLANLLWRIGHLTSNSNWLERCEKMLRGIEDQVHGYPPGYSSWMNLELDKIGPYYEVAVVGRDAKPMVLALNKSYLPGVILAGSERKNDDLPLLENRYEKGQSLIYICQNQACQRPLSDVKQAIDQLHP